MKFVARNVAEVERAHVNNKREKNKTSHVQISVFCYNGKNKKKELIYRNKVGLTVHPTKIFSQQVNAAAINTTFC